MKANLEVALRFIIRIKYFEATIPGDGRYYSSIIYSSDSFFTYNSADRYYSIKLARRKKDE